MNKYITKILIGIGSLTLSLVIANQAFAVYPTIQDCVNTTWTTPVGCDAIMDKYYAGYYSNGYDYISTTHQNTYYNNQPNQYHPYQYSNQAPITSTPVVNNYYYKDDSVSTKSTTSTTIKSSTSGNTSTKTNTSNSDTKKVNNNNVNDKEDVFTTDNNRLTAMSFRGDGGFLPSTFWQWLVVILLILIIVIIARMIARSGRDNNNHMVPVH